MSTCSRCGASSPSGDAAAVPGVCPSCGATERLSARDFLDWVVPGAVDLTPPADLPDPLDWPDYDGQRDRAAARAGTDESVVVARGPVRDSDVEVVVVAWEFAFLGGSMGGDAGARIAAGFDRARTAGLPVLLAPSTGGARMQEGMGSLVQMAASTVASRRHARAGLLQVAVLRDPTTGGVFASHANLADVVLAEPGATIGFAGPRVAEAMTGGRLPEASHTARGARAAGLVDAVVARDRLPDVLASLLGWPGGSPHHPHGAAPDHAAPDRAAPDPARIEVANVDAGTDPAGDVRPTPWDRVTAARSPDRARTPAFLAQLETAFELHGDRSGSDDPAIRPVLARLDGRPVVVVAMDPTINPNPRPSGYRKAWRGLRLAGRLGVPVVTLVDTPGADASAWSEAGGIAHHIATTFVEMLEVPAPVVALVIGEGGSGGALALAVGDRVLVQESAIFSVIAPEGAAAILFRDADRAAEVTDLLDPTARRLAALGLADEVVEEPAGREVITAWAAVARHLDDLATAGPGVAERRAVRWRHPLPGSPPTSTAEDLDT